MKPFLRKAIAATLGRQGIAPGRFAELRSTQWEPVWTAIGRRFLYPDGDGFLWQRLKAPHYSVQSPHPYPDEQLLRLIDPSERVWVLLDETLREANKYWIYEGYIGEAVRVLGDTEGIREVVVVSKKYEWLLCINQHHYLIAAGAEMEERLRRLRW